MTFPDLVTWLKERTALSILSREVLEAIAPYLQERRVSANERLVVTDTPPDGLYLLRSGRLESHPYRLSAVGLLPGAAIDLQALLLDRPVQQTLVTLSECRFWFIAAEDFRAIVAQYPEITQAFSQKRAQEVEVLSSQLVYEQERSLILRSYLVPKARRGIIGKSRYAVRLRSQIKQAAENRQPVLIFGEPGLEKDNIAALIHFSSPYRHEPIIKIDCSKLQTSGADLFGRVGGKPGLIEALGQGTLVFNNIQELPSELVQPIVTLLKTDTYTPVSRPGEPLGDRQTSQARIVIVSE